MIRRDVVLAFLGHELKEIRGNPRLLPLLLIFPALAVAFPVILTLNFFAAFLTLLGTLLSDVLYAVVDPRIRLE